MAYNPLQTILPLAEIFWCKIYTEEPIAMRLAKIMEKQVLSL